MRTLKRLAETMIKTLNPSRDRQGQAQPVQVREGEHANKIPNVGNLSAQPVQVREGERCKSDTVSVLFLWRNPYRCGKGNYTLLQRDSNKY